jgi:hypothetical protein
MSARERIPTNTIRAAKITKGTVATPTGVTYEGGDRQIFVKPGSATPDNVAAYRVTVTNSNVSPVTVNTYVIDKGVATASAGKGVGVPVPVNGLNYGMKVAEIGFDGAAGTDSAEQTVLALKLNPPVIKMINASTPDCDADDGTVTIKWLDLSGLPAGFTVTSYKIVCSINSNLNNIPNPLIPNTITGISSSLQSYTITGLTNNVQYKFNLSAIVSGGYETPGAPVNYAPCVPPSGSIILKINNTTGPYIDISTSSIFPTGITQILAQIYDNTVNPPKYVTGILTTSIIGNNLITITSATVNLNTQYKCDLYYYNTYNSSKPVTIFSNILTEPTITVSYSSSLAQTATSSPTSASFGARFTITGQQIYNPQVTIDSASASFNQVTFLATRTITGLPTKLTEFKEVRVRLTYKLWTNDTTLRSKTALGSYKFANKNPTSNLNQWFLNGNVV